MRRSTARAALLTLLRDYLPWMLAEYAPLRELPEVSVDVEADAPSIDEAPAFTQALHGRLNQAIPMLVRSRNCTRLRSSLEPLFTLLENDSMHWRDASANALDSERLAEETEFAF